jgi:hypothetical protein
VTMRQPGETVWVLKRSGGGLYLPPMFEATYVGQDEHGAGEEDVHRFRGWQGERKYRPNEEWTHPHWTNQVASIFDTEQELIAYLLPKHVANARKLSVAARRFSDEAKRLQKRLKEIETKGDGDGK